jgi:hypothetical protein
MAKGYPGFRDCVISPFHLPGAMAGGLAGVALSFALSPVWAGVLGGLALPLLLLVITSAAVVSQLSALPHE